MPAAGSRGSWNVEYRLLDADVSHGLRRDIRRRTHNLNRPDENTPAVAEMVINRATRRDYSLEQSHEQAPINQTVLRLGERCSMTLSPDHSTNLDHESQRHK